MAGILEELIKELAKGKKSKGAIVNAATKKLIGKKILPDLQDILEGITDKLNKEIEKSIRAQNRKIPGQIQKTHLKSIENAQAESRTKKQEKPTVKKLSKQDKKEKLTDAQKKQKLELRRLISIANKRLDRLEKAGITQSAALEKWQSEGGVRFSVKNKTNKELQKEYWRVKRFLDSETSTVQGAKKVVANIQKAIGVSRKLSDKELSNYFKLSEKIQEYLSSSEQSAEALDYRAIFTAINKYVQDNSKELKNTDKVLQEVLKIKEELESESGGNNYNLKYLVDI